MTTPARRRLMRDFRRLQQDPPTSVTAAPAKDDDIMKWNAVIFGPDDTAWEGGTFQLTMEFTEEYPNKAPDVRFTTKMFHPNIYQNGQICLDILDKQWSPIYDITAILTSIQSLLTDPNPNSPANMEAARLYTENRREYERRVMHFVERSWALEKGDEDDAKDEKSSDADANMEAEAEDDYFDDSEESDLVLLTKSSSSSTSTGAAAAAAAAASSASSSAMVLTTRSTTTSSSTSASSAATTASDRKPARGITANLHERKEVVRK